MAPKGLVCGLRVTFPSAWHVVNDDEPQQRDIGQIGRS